MSLRQVTRPIQIIGGDADTIAPAEECCGWLHGQVKSSKLDILKGGIDHYVFVSEPTPRGMTLAPEVFTDAEGVDRRAIHDILAQMAARLVPFPRSR